MSYKRLRHHFLVALAIFSAALAQAGEKPNIVYIIADDQTFRDFGFMGSRDALTPNIDQLASQSARFVNGYVPTSLCSPSLATLLTGLYPHQSGLHYNHPPPGNGAFNKMASREEYEAVRSPAFAIIRSQPTLPRVLGQHGYVSLQTGKFWEGHFSNAGFSEGMTTFEPAAHLNYSGVNRIFKDGSQAAHGNGDNGLAIGRETMQPIADFLDQHGGKSPFLLWYAPYLPHQPHDSPRPYYERHEGRNVAEHRIPYLASISQFDDTVGQLLELLQQRGLLENTMIVFVSDNGWTPSKEREKKRPEEFAYTHESKYSPFEDGLRTPILLRWDNKIKPATHEQLVSSVDLLPTVLEAIEQPSAIASLPGRSLLAAARGNQTLPESPVFGEIYPGDASSLHQPWRDIAYRWMREGDFKLIVPHSYEGAKPWGGYLSDVALFDLRHDAGESHNVATDHRQRVKAMKQKLDQWWNPDDAAIRREQSSLDAR